MNLPAALDKLILLEQGLEITTPVRMKVKRVYDVVPAKSKAMTEFPCIINPWSLLSIERAISLRIAVIQVNVQVFFNSPDTERVSAIAAEFMWAFISALDGDLTLGGTVTQARLRGAVPTFGTLEWAGQDYPGLNFMVELEFKESANFA